jgi:hypothetical protein
MVKLTLPSARFQAVEEAGWFSVSVPVRPDWYVIIVGGFWLCWWALGEVMATRLLFQDLGQVPLGVSAFILVWLTGWTIGGGITLYLWLWNVAGDELVAVGQGSLVLRRTVFGMGRYREFALAHIRDLHVVAPTSFAWTWGWASLISTLGGSVAFNYGARTYGFGFGLDGAEAKLLLDALRPHLPAQIFSPGA